MCSSMVILRVPFPVLNTWVLGLVFAMTPEEMEDESILIPLGGPGFHPSIGLGEVRKRYVTDADLIPTWSDDDGWLPLDWRIGFKQKPLSVHKIYIPPGLRTKWAHGGWISFLFEDLLWEWYISTLIIMLWGLLDRISDVTFFMVVFAGQDEGFCYQKQDVLLGEKNQSFCRFILIIFFYGSLTNSTTKSQPTDRGGTEPQENSRFRHRR